MYVDKLLEVLSGFGVNKSFAGKIFAETRPKPPRRFPFRRNGLKHEGLMCDGFDIGFLRDYKDDVLNLQVQAYADMPDFPEGRHKHYLDQLMRATGHWVAKLHGVGFGSPKRLVRVIGEHFLETDAFIGLQNPATGETALRYLINRTVKARDYFNEFVEKEDAMLRKDLQRTSERIQGYRNAVVNSYFKILTQ